MKRSHLFIIATIRNFEVSEGNMESRIPFPVCGLPEDLLYCRRNSEDRFICKNGMESLDTSVIYNSVLCMITNKKAREI